VFASRVVEAVDVFEEGDLDLATGLPVAAPDEFGLPEADLGDLLAPAIAEGSG
jgi:hypothetical protein